MTHPEDRATPAGPSDQAGRDRTVAELVQDATDQIRTLVRDEMLLARAELTRKGKRFGVAAGSFGGAGVFAFLSLGALVAGLTLVLAFVVPVWVAVFVMCGVLAVVAGVLALVGRNEAGRAMPAMPDQAAEGIKRDIATVREGVRR